MRVLVTGGAGYIGSHLVDRLLADAHQVVVVDNLSLGKLANIEHNLDEPRFRFVEGDILDHRLMEELIGECDLICHLAAVVGVKYVLADPLQAMMTNVWGTENVLRFASRLGSRVVLASSSEVYGKSTNSPLAEDDDCLMGSTRVSRWCYSTAKALDEHLALAYRRQKKLPVVILRYFNSYGPRMDPLGYGSVIAKFVNQALDGRPITVHGDGRQTRCFTYIDDTVEGTVLAATVDDAKGAILNIARSEETAILDLAHTIKKMTTSSSEVVLVPYEQEYGDHFEDTRRRVPDVGQAEQIVGFRAQVSLAEGLEQTITWFRSRR
ncbi:MAG: NAD-dependent epimerase/dehydratase family protein [Anaerolineae bacterium]|nr:NAD-dependent epimerase/dehydratase family protein [Anaerolineae bacterium]NIN98352.1 NAD-dependent epimerase/dehydratase family protein [Anaerolineae bacterium]NIQ81275.1 NAD-dependent epimerase/dehydratase family protein [Anaerolineae bacterium]